MNTGQWIFLLGIAVAIVVGLHQAGSSIRCRRCGRRGPWVQGPVDTPLCHRCVCPAHPHHGRATFRPERVNDCIADCWTRIPLRDLRS